MKTIFKILLIFLLCIQISSCFKVSTGSDDSHAGTYTDYWYIFEDSTIFRTSVTVFPDSVFLFYGHKSYNYKYVESIENWTDVNIFDLHEMEFQREQRKTFKNWLIFNVNSDTLIYYNIHVRKKFANRLIKTL